VQFVSKTFLRLGDSAFIAFRRDKLHDIFRVQKLGKNLGGYLGETIDVRAVLRAVESSAQQHGWSSSVLHAADDLKWLALHRHAPRTTHHAPRIYISAGIHGDEPAGPLAALELLQQNNWPAGCELWFCPCLNPAGLVLNRRENAAGIDLNRDYRDAKSAETLAHLAWLEVQPRFELYLCLHEDWESHGFYLYEQNPDGRPSLAETITAAVRKVCPIDESDTIEGRPAKHGIIRPIIQPRERPDWPEAFYLIEHKSRQGYTLEAPSDFPLQTRVNALVEGVNSACEFVVADGKG
jgi:murein peptide amidase A